MLISAQGQYQLTDISRGHRHYNDNDAVVYSFMMLRACTCAKCPERDQRFDCMVDIEISRADASVQWCSVMTYGKIRRNKLHLRIARR